MELFLLLLLLVVISLFAYYQIKGFKKLAPWLPSKTKSLEQALEYIKLPEGAFFLDFGSGDGRAVFAASKKGYVAHGVEFNTIIYLISLFRKYFGRHKANLILSDAYKHDISNYDVIYVYGLPDVMANQLSKKLAEAKPGSYFISYNFTLPNREPLKTFADNWRRVMVYQL